MQITEDVIDEIRSLVRGFIDLHGGDYHDHQCWVSGRVSARRSDTNDVSWLRWRTPEHELLTGQQVKCAGRALYEEVRLILIKHRIPACNIRMRKLEHGFREIYLDFTHSTQIC